MENLESLLKRIEKNYENKDKKETVTFEMNGIEYKVKLLSPIERAEVIFTFNSRMNLLELYKALKPYIYKAFNLAELAVKAKENGYIKTHYEVLDYLFSPEEIILIIKFFMQENNLNANNLEGIKLIKK